MLFSKSQDKVKEYIGTETETKYSSQNPTEYSSANFEPTLWMLGLISLSGLVVNLKKKTIECHWWSLSLGCSRRNSFGSWSISYFYRCRWTYGVTNDTHSKEDNKNIKIYLLPFGS